ncbi:facilitated trehalose transporter Tret1-like isoform X7 [Bombus affinis]|nr:facilitated trehalose transporter Tret1-like isoform X7 [Bombus affinis]
MVIVGTVYGWTTTSLDHLTSGTTDMPLTLTQDEFSWIVSVTVLGSMFGSLAGAQLADRRGRKYCLLLCCTIFTLGWFIIYVTTSVTMLYLARVILGIGVGIAYTINPMYVSEVANINIRGALGTLIAVNVFTGSLLTCTLGTWLEYRQLLTVLVTISFISILLNMCFPETPYFLLTKGKKKKARKSIAYYKDIVDPERVKFELRALCVEIRYELHQQSGGDLPLQSRSDLPFQSVRGAYSDSFWEVVDTEETSDLHLPSSSDSPSISAVYSEVVCEVHQRPTSELRLQPSRDSRQLHSQSTSEIHQPSTSEIHRPFTSKIRRSSTSEIHRPPKSKIHRSSTSEIHRPSTSEVHRPSTSEVHRPPTIKIHRSSTSEIHQPSTSEVHRPPTIKIHRSSTSEIHQPSTSEVHRPSTSEVHRPPTSEIHRPSTSQIQRPSASAMHPESTSEIRRLSPNEIESDLIRVIRSSSDSRTQSDVDSRESSDTDETYMDETEHTSLSKLRIILHGNHRKALFIMLGLIMAQQLSGNFVTTQYLQVLFSKTTIVINPYEATVLVQLVSLISGTLTILTVEFIGRRKLLILSTGGSCVTLSILATYLLLAEHKYDVSDVSFVPVIDLIINQVVFQIGLGTLPNVILCELFPTELRGFVGAIIVIFDSIIGFTVSKLYQVITDNVGSYVIYFIFATSCCLACLMLFIWVPETKGKTYQEIEALLVGKNLNSLNEEVRTDEMDN